MPMYQTARTNLYYDFFAFDPPGTARTPPQTLLLVHGFAGTPTSDFAGQLPAFGQEYNILAPHLHGYGRSTPRQGYTPQYYREDVADLVALLDMLDLEKYWSWALAMAQPSVCCSVSSIPRASPQ